MHVIILDIHNAGTITLSRLDNNSPALIESTLGNVERRVAPSQSTDDDNENERFTAALDGLESLILAQFTAGLITDVAEYEQTVITAYAAICDRIFD